MYPAFKRALVEWVAGLAVLCLLDAQHARQELALLRCVAEAPVGEGDVRHRLHDLRVVRAVSLLLENLAQQGRMNCFEIKIRNPW